MTVIDKFLKFVSYDTGSDYDSKTFPSTATQLAFGNMLAEYCRQLGLSHVDIDRYGYVTAELPANHPDGSKGATVGLIAHMDTSNDAPTSNINPRIIKNYNGLDILLNKEKNIVLSPAEFPELLCYTGMDLIVTDGATLLGADDKAGIAEILTALEFFLHNPDISHPTVKICFTPDEEVGRGVDYFDVKKFAADFAYTIDGGEIGGLEYENFNAARAIIHIEGKSIHPGYAKDKMINASLVGNEILNCLPKDETPAHTSGYEGFYHVVKFSGTVGQGEISILIRDFDKEHFHNRKVFLQKVVEDINKKYGNCAALTIKDEYFNMLEKIKEHPYIIDVAKRAMEEAGVTPKVQPIRGGTDGARLSYMGLLCPNIFTGGHNFHGVFEFIPIQSMEKAVEVIKNIIVYSR